MILRSKDNKVFKTASAALFDKRSETEVATINDIDDVDDFMAEIGESDINPTLALTADGSFKTGKLLSVLPPNGSGDFTVTGGGNAVSQRSDGTWQINWPANTPHYSYLNGVPSVLVESQRQNLITYPRSFGNSYWTKTGATIEGDPTTVGTNLVGTLDFTTGWITTSATVNSANSFTTTSSGGIYLSIPAIVAGGFYRLKIKGTQTAGKTLTFPNTNVPSISTKVFDLELTGNASIVKNLYISTQSGNTVTFEILEYATISPKSYECPFVDSSGVNTLEGFKLVEDTSTGIHSITSSTIAVLTGQRLTLSIRVKKGENNHIYMRSSTQSRWAAAAYFNLNNGTKTDINGTSTINLDTDGYYLITITGVVLSDGNVSALINLVDSDGVTISYTGDGTSGIYICHAQLEQASSASSPIYGAEGSALTRNADNIITTYSGLNFGTGDFSIHVGVTPSEFNLINGIFSTDAFNTPNGFAFYSTNYDLRIYNGAGFNFINFFTAADINTEIKITLVRTGRSVKAYKNKIYFGEITIPDGVDITTTNKYLGSRIGSYYYNGAINETIFFDTALTAQQIESL